MSASILTPSVSIIEYITKNVAGELNEAGIACLLWNRAAMGVYGYIDKPLGFDIKTIDFIVSDDKFDLAKVVLAAAYGGSCEKPTPTHLDLGHSEVHFLWKPSRTHDPEPTEPKILVGLVRQRVVLWKKPPLRYDLPTNAAAVYQTDDFVSTEHRDFPTHVPGAEPGAKKPEGYGRHGIMGHQAFIMRPHFYVKTLILCAVRHYKGKRHVPIEADILKAMCGCLGRYERELREDLKYPYHSLYRELRDSDVARPEWVQRACQVLSGSPDLDVYNQH